MRELKDDEALISKNIMLKKEESVVVVGLVAFGHIAVQLAKFEEHTMS